MVVRRHHAYQLSGSFLGDTDIMFSVMPPPARQETAGRSPYVELAARSCFSFLQGASSPAALLGRARQLGYDAIAIADRDGLYGMARAHEAAQAEGIRLVVGCELTIDPPDPARPSSTLLVHVQDHAGYSNLCRVLSESHARYKKGKPRDARAKVPRNCYAGATIDALCARAAGLWALVPAETDDAVLSAVKEAFGERASIAVHRHLDGDDRRAKAAVRAHKRFELPVCATNAVRYARREDKPLFDILHCIREGVTLDQAGRALAPNAEARLKSERAMLRLFAKKPAWIHRSRAIADACTFAMSELRYRFPCEIERPAHPGETADEALRRLSYQGARERYPAGIPAGVERQIDKELALIAELDVAPYFLSVRSIVDIAKRRDILCQGRGSAANSAVCYCLGITAVDPERSSLLFERFLSVERREPPDIDVDFEHERREEVIQEIYARYGRERAAMVSEVISYRGRSALREVGKAFGLSLEQIGRLSGLHGFWDGTKGISAARLREAGFAPNDARVRQVLHYARALEGIPRHLSIHVGGFVLSATSLVEVAPIEPATMPDRTVIPWDKDDIDILGFFKVDVLGLGMLTAIRKTLAFVQDDERLRAETAIDRLAKIPPEDPRVYDALCRADTVGVFQIESRAQMAMLPRLRPRKFYDLVIEVAIVRPGPIQGGMVHPYLRRRDGKEPVTAPHPCIAPILERTLGVPLFQEQVMQIAICGAGYTGGEADELRRDMGAWRRNGRLERHRERLFAGLAARGVPRPFAERLYKQIQGFGEYGFPESHAASFALLVYSSSWLKVHHPAAFAAALINSQPMGFYSVSTIVQDAQRHGVEVRPICIEQSQWDCTLERDGALRVGLRQIRGMGEQVARRIEAARAERPFADVDDLASRASLDMRALEALAEAGALERIVRGRRHALWKARGPRPVGLFAGKDLDGDERPELPPLPRGAQLVLDYQRTGLSVTDHPMRIARPALPREIKSARELCDLAHGTRVSVAGMVICRQRPDTANRIVFVTLEDETGLSNLVVFADVFERFRRVATTSTLLVARGTIEREREVIHVRVDSLEPLVARELQLPAMSRDFR